MDDAMQLKVRISELLQSLSDNAIGDIKSHVVDIWKRLKENEELVHILTEEEISQIVQGLNTISNVKLVAADKKPGRKKKLNLDDLEI